MNRGSFPEVTEAAKAFAVANPTATQSVIRKGLIEAGVPKSRLTVGVLQYARQCGKKAAMNGHTNGHHKTGQEASPAAVVDPVDTVLACVLDVRALRAKYGAATVTRALQFVERIETN